MNFLRKTSLRSLIYAGITPDMNLDMSLRMQMANLAALLGIFSNISFSILFYKYDSIGKGLIPLVNTPFGIAIAFSIYLNYKKKYNISRYLLLFSIPTVVFLTTALFYGNLLGAHYFFLLFSMLPFLTLSYSDKYKIFIYFFLNILLFFYIGYVHVPPLLSPDSPFYLVEVRESFQIVSISICFMIMAVVLFYFLRNTNRNQSELQKANVYKDRIFSILAHDLKGPIGSMGTFLGILLESNAKITDEDVKIGLKELQKNANQCYVVLENLLEWVKKDTNHLQFFPESVPLISLINDSLDLFQIQSNDKNIKWQISVPDHYYVYVDERMMSTVLRNFFSNALKFSNEDSVITVDALESRESIQLTVTDRGIGMTQEKLDSIETGMSVRSDFGTFGERGTGIGLLVSIDLLRIQNAQIEFESHLGQGTKIKIQLPKKMN